MMDRQSMEIMEEMEALEENNPNMEEEDNLTIMSNPLVNMEMAMAMAIEEEEVEADKSAGLFMNLPVRQDMSRRARANL
jgi:hypothetical protein